MGGRRGELAGGAVMGNGGGGEGWGEEGGSKRDVNRRGEEGQRSRVEGSRKGGGAGSR